MNNPLKKISIVLILIVILPAVAFSVYEVISLNKNEAVIEEIYNKQLDAIIYSINQFSQDVVSGWAFRIDETGDNALHDNLKIKQLLLENRSIRSIIFSDSLSTSNTVFESVGNVLRITENSEEIKQILWKNFGKSERLFSYVKGGYKKIEPFTVPGVSDISMLLFVTSLKSHNMRICVIAVDPVEFVNSLLATKMQEVSQEDIIISCLYAESNEEVYSNFPGEEKKFEKEKPLWLLPNYKIAISLKGRTIEGLVKQRSVSFLILILLLTGTLVLSVLFVYRNISREIKFAQLKSDFVSNVSHELRTPLALISMFAETLEMNRVNSEEKKREYYNIISSETNRLGKIVNSLLNFSKMEAGKREYKMEEHELNSLVGDVLDTYNFHLTNKGFSAEQILFDGKLRIKCDKEALSEALINLLDNAVKYSSEIKKIVISTGYDDSFVFVEIKDFGIGIPDEHQKKIFEKFFRVSSGLVHNTKGTGMGLSIVKQIVDAHGGSVIVNSRLNEGSTFRVRLPELN